MKMRSQCILENEIVQGLTAYRFETEQQQFHITAQKRDGGGNDEIHQISGEPTEMARPGLAISVNWVTFGRNYHRQQIWWGSDRIAKMMKQSFACPA
jgi:hypothetical protein